MKFDKNICYSCMAVLPPKTAVCPYCHFNLRTHKQNPRCLQPKTFLHERYMIGKVLGEGGFGITYIGYDTKEQEPIAIKEYFPVKSASRDCIKSGSNHIYYFDKKSQKQDRVLFDKYIKEAKTLYQFGYLDGIVTTKDFFFENNTAYIIMEYIEGITLKQYLDTNGTLTPKDTFELMMPIMLALEKIHQKGIIHRDISPDNIMIRMDGTFKLIDFGAARLNNDLNGSSLTIILKRGFAPEEQYRMHGKQGPWTDVYALCATMYQMLTNVVPPEAMERVIQDDLVPLTKYPIDITKEQSDAIQKGLAVKAEKRFSSIKELRFALTRKETLSYSKELHMIATIRQADGFLLFYRLFDRSTGQTMDFTKDQLIDAIPNKKLIVNNLIVYEQYIQPVGGSIDRYPVLNSNGILQYNDTLYFAEYSKSTGYTCLNYKGETIHLDSTQIYDYIAKRKIANENKLNHFLSLNHEKALLHTTTAKTSSLSPGHDTVSPKKQPVTPVSEKVENVSVNTNISATDKPKKLSLVTDYSSPLALASNEAGKHNISKQLVHHLINESKKGTSSK